MSQLTQRRVKEEETGGNKTSVVIQVGDGKDHRGGREEKLQGSLHLPLHCGGCSWWEEFSPQFQDKTTERRVVGATQKINLSGGETSFREENKLSLRPFGHQLVDKWH